MGVIDDLRMGLALLLEDFVLAIRAGFRKFDRSGDSEPRKTECDHTWDPSYNGELGDLGPCTKCGIKGTILFPDLPLPDKYHFQDCELYGQGMFADGCWCQHRGPHSHYGGGLKPGWHRAGCKHVGKPWSEVYPHYLNPWQRIKPWSPFMDHDGYWSRPACSCNRANELGGFVLTMEDGTIHGPPPSPMPGKD